MDSFKAKMGPLPVWAWGLVAAGGALALFYWRGRSGGSSSDTTSQDQQDQAAALSSLGYLGYADGGTAGAGGGTGTGGSSSGGTNGSGGGSSGPIVPDRWHGDPNHRRLVKDPSGAWRVVVGFGHWYRKTKGGHWFWTPGPIPTKGAQSPLHYRPGPGLNQGVPDPTSSSSSAQAAA